MSFFTWTCEGIGFNVNDSLKLTEFFKNHVESISEKEIKDYIKNTSEVDIDELREMSYNYSLAAIVADIIDVETGCCFEGMPTSEEGYEYVLYERKYIWEMAEWEKKVKTREDVVKIMQPYADELDIRIMTSVEISYCG